MKPEDLVEQVAQFTHDPEGFVDFAFDWGHGSLTGKTGPRKWQREVFQHLGARLQNPATRYQPIHIGVSSGHGIGKSAFVGMLVTWALSTCEDTKIVYTANTATQLRTKTTPEIHKWFRLSIVASWFELLTESIKSVDKEHSNSWKADAVTWSLNNTEAFAGLHNEGKRIVIIFDEASGIDDVPEHEISGLKVQRLGT